MGILLGPLRRGQSRGKGQTRRKLLGKIQNRERLEIGTLVELETRLPAKKTGLKEKKFPNRQCNEGKGILIGCGVPDIAYRYA